MNINDQPFFSIKEASILLRVSEPSIRRRIKDGTIPIIRIGKRIIISSSFFRDLSDGKNYAEGKNGSGA